MFTTPRDQETILPDCDCCLIACSNADHASSDECDNLATRLVRFVEDDEDPTEFNLCRACADAWVEQGETDVCLDVEILEIDEESESLLPEPRTRKETIR